jgi:hypothetical protein
VSNGYIPLSEMEVSEGYTDIYMMRDPRHKDTLNENDLTFIVNVIFF